MKRTTALGQPRLFDVTPLPVPNDGPHEAGASAGPTFLHDAERRGPNERVPGAPYITRAARQDAALITFAREAKAHGRDVMDDAGEMDPAKVRRLANRLLGRVESDRPYPTAEEFESALLLILTEDELRERALAAPAGGSR